VPSPSIRYTESPRMVVASLSRRGAYGGIREAMLELDRWVEAKGLKRSGDPFCLFYDNPLETAEKDLRSEACIPVAAPFAAGGRVEMKEFPGGPVAETSHSGPQEEFTMTYGAFLEGLLKAGYQLMGPAREYFRRAADVRGPGSGFLIQQPIRKR
jgi:AraC family transcriptional regulator